MPTAAMRNDRLGAAWLAGSYFVSPAPTVVQEESVQSAEMRDAAQKMTAEHHAQKAEVEAMRAAQNLSTKAATGLGNAKSPLDATNTAVGLAAAQAAGQEAKNVFDDMRDLVTTDVSILGAPFVIIGLTRLWAGARAANYLWPFFNIAISNVPGPRQPMYCVGAPATHYFPVSIPYHGCALNITVQSYLDQLDFGLVACRETVPDAQRIADLIGEDFAAMRKADANLRRPEAIETIAAAARPAPVAAHKPIELVEAKAEPRTSQADKGSTLTRNIEALSVTTEALLRQLDGPRAPATTAAKARGSRPKTKVRKLTSRPPAVKGAPRKASAPDEPAPPASPQARGKRRAAAQAQR